jgi:Chaperone of endosialidase
MANSHSIADSAYELQATCYDLLPACIRSTTFPTVPVPPSLTLAAFSTKGYVLDGPTLVYVEQEAHTVTLTGGDGQYWLALTQDTWTSIASWNRVAGCHYAWRPSATEPASVDGLLVFAQLTVSGGAITAVTPLTKVTNQPMSKQNSNAVVITGGQANFTANVATFDRSGDNQFGLITYLEAAGGTNRWGVRCNGTAPSYFGGTVQVVGNVGLGTSPFGGHRVNIDYLHNSINGIALHPTDNDTGTGGHPLLVLNVANTIVGSITSTATATSFNTSSDIRLKHAIAPLTAALDRVRALHPVQFLWRSDDSPGVGFIADEVAQIVDGVITGQANAVNEDGDIVPQQIDHSKLVPWLTAALKETLAQVEALTARVEALEGALA